MSKRANETQEIASESKRARATAKEGHASDCTDDLCQGCDVGEIEISFIRKDADGKPIDTEPTASELLAMAIDEASNDKKNDSDEDNNGVARRLFDMALEKYQKDEPKNRVGYAVCLVELGKTIQVEESISEGLEVLRGELKKNPKDKSVLIKSASAAISLATSKRKSQQAYFEEQQEELENSDDEVDEVALGELLKKQQLTKEEMKLYQEAIQHIKEAFDAESQDESLLKETQAVLHEMRTYGQLLSQPFHKEHSNAVLNVVIDLIHKLPNYEENDELLTIWAACLLHQQNFNTDDHRKQVAFKEAEDLLIKANKLHLAKHKKENPRVWEMLAMLRINQSNSADNEDEVLELYDEAIIAFKKAHALNPDNPELSRMVNTLQGIQEAVAAEVEAEEDEEDEEK